MSRCMDEMLQPMYLAGQALHPPDCKHGVGIEHPPGNGSLSPISHYHCVPRLWLRFGQNPVHCSTVYHGISTPENSCLAFFQNHPRHACTSTMAESPLLVAQGIYGAVCRSLCVLQAEQARASAGFYNTVATKLWQELEQLCISLKVVRYVPPMDCDVSWMLVAVLTGAT